MLFQDPLIWASIQRLEKLILDSEVPKDDDSATGGRGELQTPVPSSEDEKKQPLVKEYLHTPVEAEDPYDSLRHRRHSSLNLSYFYSFQSKRKAKNQQDKPPFPSFSSTQDVPFVVDAVTVESRQEMRGDRELSNSGLSNNDSQLSYSPSDMEEEPQVVQKHFAANSKDPCKQSDSNEKTSAVSQSGSSVGQRTAFEASEGGAGASNIHDGTTSSFRRVCELLKLYCGDAISIQLHACAAFVMSASVYPLHSRQALRLAEICFLYTTFMSHILSAAETLTNRDAVRNLSSIENYDFVDSFVKISAAMPVLQYEFHELLAAYVALMRSDPNSDPAAWRRRSKEGGIEFQIDVMCEQLDVASKLLPKAFQKLVEPFRP